MEYWLGLGIILIAVELLSFSFVLLFFGIAALLVGLAKLAGLNHLPVEVVLFATIGLASTFFFRKKFSSMWNPSKGFRGDVTLLLSRDLAPGETATIQYQGTNWSGVNTTDQRMDKNSTVKISKTEGVKLFLSR
jgi:membrane protein implicated in regulation of membrane protease activity